MVLWSAAWLPVPGQAAQPWGTPVSTGAFFLVSDQALTQAPAGILQTPTTSPPKPSLLSQGALSTLSDSVF